MAVPTAVATESVEATVTARRHLGSVAKHPSRETESTSFSQLSRWADVGRGGGNGIIAGGICGWSGLSAYRQILKKKSCTKIAIFVYVERKRRISSFFFFVFFCSCLAWPYITSCRMPCRLDVSIRRGERARVWWGRWVEKPGRTAPSCRNQ